MERQGVLCSTRPVSVLLVAMNLLVLCPPRMSAQFEGVFETRNTTTDETGARVEFTMTMWIKPDRVKISSGGAGAQGGTTMIYRSDRQVIWMLNTDERTYVEMDQEGGPTEPRAPSDNGGYRIKRTGKKASILGYQCEQVVISRRDEGTELWGSRRLRRLQETLASVLGAGRTATPAEWTDQVDRLGLFPLRSTTKIGGQLVESQEVTRIEETVLPPEIFDLPAGYRKQDMENMLQELPAR